MSPRLIMLLIFITTVRSHADSDYGSFTPISIRVPIESIYISAENHSIVGTLHECAWNNPGDCTIDVTDQNALDAFFQGPKFIPAGEYRKISISTCRGNRGRYSVQVKGSVEISGVRYYTTASAATPLSTDVADLDYTTLTFSGCQRDYLLPTPVHVAANASLDVSLFIPLNNIAWAGLGPSIIPEGCVQSADGSRSVCAGYPDVTPYIGKTEPVTETYHIFEPPNGPETSGGQVTVLFDSNGKFIGGSTRRLYIANSKDGHTNFDTPIRIAEENRDGSYHFENYGSSGTTSYLSFPAFLRSDHFAKFISYSWGGQEFDYGAVRVF